MPAPWHGAHPAGQSCLQIAPSKDESGAQACSTAERGLDPASPQWHRAPVAFQTPLPKQLLSTDLQNLSPLPRARPLRQLYCLDQQRSPVVRLSKESVTEGVARHGARMSGV